MPFVILVLNVELVQPEKTGVQSALVKIVSRVRPKQNHFKASCHSDMCLGYHLGIGILWAEVEVLYVACIPKSTLMYLPAARKRVSLEVHHFENDACLNLAP